MIEYIKHQQQLLAILVCNKFNEPGVNFLTPAPLSQQLAFIKQPAGHQIAAHTHKMVSRQVYNTQEVLYIKKGKLRVDFFDHQQHYLESRILRAGDVILLVAGGHGFEVLEELEMIEVKQGPYVGEDKVRFVGVK